MEEKDYLRCVCLLCFMVSANLMVQTFKSGPLTYTVEMKNGKTYAAVTVCDDVESVIVTREVTDGCSTYIW